MKDNFITMIDCMAMLECICIYKYTPYWQFIEIVRFIKLFTMLDRSTLWTQLAAMPLMLLFNRCKQNIYLQLLSFPDKLSMFYVCRPECVEGTCWMSFIKYSKVTLIYSKNRILSIKEITRIINPNKITYKWYPIY